MYGEFPSRDLRRFRSGQRFGNHRDDVFPNMERLRVGPDVFLDEFRFDVRFLVRFRLCLERLFLRGERLVVGNVGRVFRGNRKLVVRRMGKLFRFLRRRNPIPYRDLRAQFERNPIPHRTVPPVRRRGTGRRQLPRGEARNLAILHPRHRRGVRNRGYQPVVQYAGVSGEWSMRNRERNLRLFVPHCELVSKLNEVGCRYGRFRLILQLVMLLNFMRNSGKL